MNTTHRVSVPIFADSRYPVDRKVVRHAVIAVLDEYRMSDRPVTVEVTIVGDRRMRALNRDHRGVDTTTDVLSFPTEDLAPLSDGTVHLGDVVVSFPQARAVGVRMNRLIDRVIADLVTHGVKHLVGEHHD